MSQLIEGLPDAVSIMCLARIPFQLYPKLELVCRSWQEAFHSAELYKAREEVNAVEEFLCVCALYPDNLWQLYDPRQDLWITLPVLPSTIRHLAHFGVVSTAGKLFVLGGGSAAIDPSTGDQDGSFATDEVWSYDLISRKWSLRASMLVPRAKFACCVLDGKVIVAGGFTNCRKSISKAEVYDPEKDVWDSIPDLYYTHNSACSGVVIEGKVHVLHKWLSLVEVLDDIKQGWSSVHDHGWLQGPMAVVRGELYVMTRGLIYKQERNSSKEVVPAPDFHNIIDCTITGLGDDIYVIGGVGPGLLNWDSEPLSDVYVLSLGSERPVWRKVSPMTKCRGSILGCTNLRI